MQALRLLGQQLGKIWQQLGLNQKVIIVISGLAVLAGLGGLVFWTSRPSYALLYGKLSDPTEVGKMITALEEMKIPYKAGPGGTSIYVPQDQAAKVRMELMAKGLPKAEGVGFEIFEKPAFGMSDFQQQANYNRALQTELARSIIWIEGVEQARVSITRPESRLLIDPQKKAKAAVMLKLKSTLPPNAVGSIQRLVANSVEGLKASDVSVSDNAGNLLSEDAEEGSIAALATGQLNMKRGVEKYLTGKVKKMLETVVGIDQVAVEVSADVNTDAVTMTGEAYTPSVLGGSSGLALSETTRTENKTDVAPNPGGTVGTAINSNTDTNSAVFAATTNSLVKNDKTIQYALNRSSSNIVQMAGGLKRGAVKAAVFVNTNDNPVFHFALTNAPIGITNQMMLTTNILNNLRVAVINALGADLGVEVGQSAAVAIYGMSFNEKKAVQYKAQLEKSERTEWLWKIGRSLLYALMGIAAMVGFWKLVKTSSEELLPTGIPVGQLVGGQLVYETPVAQPGMMGMGMPSGVVAGMGMAEQKVDEAMGMGVEEEVEELQAAKSKLVMDFGLGQQAPERITIEVLKQLIRENPAKMSQAARSWMSRKLSDTDEM